MEDASGLARTCGVKQTTLESAVHGVLAGPRGDGMTEWRGKVEHVPSGEAQYFRDWPALQAFLERMLQRLEGEGDPPVEE